MNYLCHLRVTLQFRYLVWSCSNSVTACKLCYPKLFGIRSSGSLSWVDMKHWLKKGANNGLSIGRAIPLNSRLVYGLRELHIQICLFTNTCAHTYTQAPTHACQVSIRTDKCILQGSFFIRCLEEMKKKKVFHFTLPKWLRKKPLPILFEHVQKTTYKNKIQ